MLQHVGILQRAIPQNPNDIRESSVDPLNSRAPELETAAATMRRPQLAKVAKVTRWFGVLQCPTGSKMSK